jgi:hypothetical protein
MMQLAIDVAKEMIVNKTFWIIIIGGAIIMWLCLEWSENK